MECPDQSYYLDRFKVETNLSRAVASLVRVVLLSLIEVMYFADFSLKVVLCARTVLKHGNWTIKSAEHNCECRFTKTSFSYRITPIHFQKSALFASVFLKPDEHVLIIPLGLILSDCLSFSHLFTPSVLLFNGRLMPSMFKILKLIC